MLENEQERWLSYAEVGRLLGISPAAARMHAKRRGWARRSPNAIGAQAMVLVPADAAVRPRATGVQRTVQRTDGPFSEQPNGHDQANNSAIRAALAALTEQLTIANRRIDELQAALTEERRRVIEILTGPRPFWKRWLR